MLNSFGVLLALTVVAIFGCHLQKNAPKFRNIFFLRKRRLRGIAAKPVVFATHIRTYEINVIVVTQKERCETAWFIPKLLTYGCSFVDAELTPTFSDYL